ncbi:protein FAM111A-like isoform X2 [Sphaeramia orbicularis]|uniref:protein FAM111A-like isoform X2 n=1 Tax=Sphaeramia orbicularis TaxID=375764 RepID=UPI0011805AB2|nr:protein FAM111A-like isoform X2 [Sphaeramia orbicularis]
METSKTVMEPKTEEPKAETSKTVMKPKADEPKVETSKTVMEPKAEEPKVETSKTLMEPKTEEPKVETSKTLMEPKTEEPKVETSKTLMEPKAEVKSHAPHSFKWTDSDKRTTNITCNEAGTVENSLRKSSQFRQLEGKKQANKELVVSRSGKAISSHFPCSLIKPGERLTVQHVKASEKLNQSSGQSGDDQRELSDQYVEFNVKNKGKNLRKILKNPAIEALDQELTVYAHKGEEVRHALERDGRFQETIFQKNCALVDTNGEFTEMSNLVDDLDGKTFQIILLNKSCPPDSQPGSLDDTCAVQSESPPSDLNENCDPSPSSTPAKTEEKPKLNDFMVCVIPGSEKICELLRSQLQNWVRTELEGKPKQSVPGFLRAEFGKRCETSFEVKTGKTLMRLSDSVCQVRIDGSPAGSGFLLFDTFVLTNGHVLKTIFDWTTWRLHGKVTVHFSHENQGQPGVGHKVQEVVASEYRTDESGYKRDWALLSLCPDQTLPDELLSRFTFCPPGGSIYIIGHPDGGVKKIDPCWIIPIVNRTDAVYQHGHYSAFQFLTHASLENIGKQIKFNRQILTYNTCFYFLSSGSPVFDKQCNVVAVHSGGYNYKTPNSRDSVIDFGYPLSDIIEQMVIQLVQREKLDVLTKYFTSKSSKHEDVLNNVKKVVDIRKYPEFKTAINNPEIRNNENLKKFFESFTQTQEP